MRNFYYLCTLLLIMIISSCKTATKVVEIPVETIKKEYINSIKIDSVYVRDSIDRWQKGDTLYITKWHTKLQHLNPKKDMKYVKDIIISMTEPPLPNVAWLQPPE